MSGLELLGAVAATSQVFGYLLDLVNALLEIRDHIIHSSARVQAYRDRLDSLARTIQYIQANPLLLTHVVEALLQAISQSVNSLNGILRKSFSRIPPRASQRLMRVYAEKRAERRIRDMLANLESYKIDLAICISSTRQMATEHINTGRMEEDGGVLIEDCPQNNQIVASSISSPPRTDTAGSSSTKKTTETSAIREEKARTAEVEANNDDYTDNEFYDAPAALIGHFGEVTSKGSLLIKRNKIHHVGVAFAGRACLEATQVLLRAPQNLTNVPLHRSQKPGNE